MTDRCPGQDTRNLRSAFYKCPNCGTLVEMFSDELRFRCRQCGEYVYRDSAPSCVEWCARARECLGEERWRTLQDSTRKDSNGKD